MRWVLTLVLLASVAAAQTRSPVLVELFTSEGCSSCPSADELAIKLEKWKSHSGGEVIVLGEHVDYWDGQGWHDRFSSWRFTQRQESYARRFGLDGPYTPEMVVNGRVECVGNDSRRVVSNIENAAARATSASIQVRRSGDGVRIAVQNAGKHRLDVMLALTETGLTTQVHGGENRGRELHHAAVVRTLAKIGSTHDGSFEDDYPLHVDPSWRPENLHAVVFLQNGAAGEVVSATQIPLN
jgi:hypothetical protein